MPPQRRVLAHPNHRALTAPCRRTKLPRPARHHTPTAVRQHAFDQIPYQLIDTRLPRATVPPWESLVTSLDRDRRIVLHTVTELPRHETILARRRPRPVARTLRGTFVFRKRSSSCPLTKLQRCQRYHPSTASAPLLIYPTSPQEGADRFPPPFAPNPADREQKDPHGNTEP